MDESGEHTRVLIYSHESFGLGHLRRWRAIANGLVERNPNMSVLILSGSPIIRQLRIPPARRLRARPRRHQAAQRRVHLAQPQARHRGHDGDARLDHPPHRRCVRPGPLPGRQGAAWPARRSRRDPGDAQGARHGPGARPARRARRALAAGARMGAQERAAGAAGPLRRDLGLWPAAALRSVGRAAAERFDPPARRVHRLPGALGGADLDTKCAGPPVRGPVPFGHAGRRRRRRSAGRTGCCAPTRPIGGRPIPR